MKPSKQSNACISCSTKCCSQSYVEIPLTPTEAQTVGGLGYAPLEKKGVTIMPSGPLGCGAYDVDSGRCNIYMQEPGFCRLYPVKVVSVQIPTGMYDGTWGRFALLMDKCRLGKRMELTGAAVLKELKDADILETLRRHANKFNTIRERDVEERVREGFAEVFYSNEI